MKNRQKAGYDRARLGRFNPTDSQDMAFVGARPSPATELSLTARELPDVQRSWFPYVPPIVGTIGSGETPAATAWAKVRTSAR